MFLSWSFKNLNTEPGFSSNSGRTLTYIWASESSHLFFLLWLCDFQPQLPPPLLYYTIPPFPSHKNAPHCFFSLIHIIAHCCQTHPTSWGATLASIMSPQTDCSTTPSFSTPSKTPPLLCPLFSSCRWSEQDWIRKNYKAKGKYVPVCQPSPLFKPQLPELIVRQEEAEHFGQTSPARSPFSLWHTLFASLLCSWAFWNKTVQSDLSISALFSCLHLINSYRNMIHASSSFPSPLPSLL